MTEPNQWKEFEDAGEEIIRERVTRGLYSGSNLTRAKAWLEKQDHARYSEASLRSESSSAEQIRIARSAKNAAWAAAIAAIIAAICAIIAITST